MAEIGMVHFSPRNLHLCDTADDIAPAAAVNQKIILTICEGKTGIVIVKAHRLAGAQYVHLFHAHSSSVCRKAVFEKHHEPAISRLVFKRVLNTLLVFIPSRRESCRSHQR